MAIDANCKTDWVVNNLNEVYNKIVIYVRGKHVRTMFEGIITNIMVKYETTWCTTRLVTNHYHLH
jgi:hypothetical protein